MDDDIVHRLLTAAKGQSNTLLIEAADEIERLRTALHDVAFKAIDYVSETAIYKVRKKYATKAMQQAKAASAPKRREQERNVRLEGRRTLSDRYIKLLLSKNGNVRFKDITPDVIQIKRDQLIAERLAKQLQHAAATNQKDDHESIEQHA